MASLATALPDLAERGAAVGATITPMTPTIGAEIAGLDLDRPLSSQAADWLREAWVGHKVIFIRDQDLSHDAHVRVARLFGELEGHPVLPSVPGYPEILSISGVEGAAITAESYPAFRAFNKWHADVTFRERPSMGSVLRSRLIPPVGGDTIWADAAAAYAGLPREVQERIADLDAEHDVVKSFGSRVSDEKRAQLARDLPPVRHPVVRKHPETGELVLYVNYTFTTRILDIDPGESDTLLKLLFDRIKVPEYHIRFRWTPNALAIWDNRSTQHYAVGDYWPQPRTMERATISGDVVRR